MMIEPIYRYLAVVLFGIIATLEPTIKFAFILFFAIVLDCLSAYDLSRRLKKQYPDRVVGKFQSHFALKMFKTFLQAYLVIVLLHLIDVELTGDLGYWSLSNIGAATFCGIQLWSILENISSSNGAGWAKVLQKIMIDKTKRHFDIDLSDKNEL